MANNQYVNKVEANSETLIDLTSDTATASDVIVGKSFHLASGAPATGTLGNATQSTDGLMSSTDKVKLDGIETGAQVNPGNATQSADGLMSATDKTKLDGIEEGANNYTLPTMSSTTKGGAKLGSGLKVDSDTLSLGDVVTSATDGPIYSIDAEGWAEQDGTPTPNNPQEIRVARGRNLLDRSTDTTGYYLSDSDGQPTSNANAEYTNYIPVEHGDTYTLSCVIGYDHMIRVHGYNESNVWQSRITSYNTSSSDIGKSRTITFVIPEGVTKIRISFGTLNSSLQLELGSTPTPYVPYGHVGLEVRNATTQALIDIRAIPLPLKSDGERWAGGLPDDTADTLAIDSAGRWEWTSETDEAVFDGSSDEGWVADSYNVGAGYYSTKVVPVVAFRSAATGKTLCNALKYGGGYSGAANTYYFDSSYYANCIVPSFSDLTAWTAYLASSPIHMLYVIATPTTEHGYVDLPMDIPEGATITIPELESVGVKCFVPGAKELAQHAANWGHRNQEMESRITALESQIAEIATA